MNAPLWVAIPVLVIAALAAQADVRTSKVPNRLTGPALLLGLGVHFAVGGVHDGLNALVGALVAGGVLFPGWLLGFMGAGDVKLMAAAGAWLGHPQGLIAVLGALIIDGAIKLVWAARRGVLMQSIRGTALLGSWMMSGAARGGPPPVTTGVRLPFALAACAGVVLSLWLRI